MDFGRKNLQAGWLFILVAALIGFGLNIVLGIKDLEFVSVAMRDSLGHGYIQALVVAFVNLFLGMLLDRSDLSEIKKKVASILALLALLQPAGMIIGVFCPWTVMVVIERIGTTCLLLAACIMASAFYLPEVRRTE